MTSFEEEYHIQAVAHVFRLLTSWDRSIRTQAWRSLEAEVQRWLGGRKPTEEELLLFLNGSTAAPLNMSSSCGRTPRCIWKKVRKCIRPLRRKFLGSFEFGLSAESKELKLCLLYKDETTAFVDADHRSLVYKVLLASVAYRHSALLRETYVDQGAVFHAIAKCPAGAKTILGGVGLSSSTWQFVHRARLNQLPVNAIKVDTLWTT